MTVNDFLNSWNDDRECVLVHTSGSTGKPKPMWVEKRRMENSARMTCDFLGLNAGDTALLCMPLDFIAGKMMVVRSIVRQLRLYAVGPSAHPLSKDSLKDIDVDCFDFVAMTPMQVFSTLQDNEERCRLLRCSHLLIGGGAVSRQLEDELRLFPNAVWSSYGMTETLSHIALRRINGSGASEWYTTMSGVSVGQSADGCLWIEAPAIVEGRLQTNDIVRMNDDGRRFMVIGRKDNIICSGGIKIQMEEVERLLLPHLPMKAMISKCRDDKFGETVVLLAESDAQSNADIEAVCRDVLPKYWCPKKIVNVCQLPTTATGKPDRATAERMASC